MFTKIHNVVIAVKDAKEAAKLYIDNFGLQVSKYTTRPDLGLKNALIPIGDATIEFIEPLDPQQGPISKFLQNRGEGLYMIELEVESIDSAIKSFSEKGVRLLGADPESRAKGGLVFIHPQSAKGVLIQLVQKA
ncbi:VOC family protein [Chloroflexota bacterium]